MTYHRRELGRTIHNIHDPEAVRPVDGAARAAAAERAHVRDRRGRGAGDGLYDDAVGVRPSSFPFHPSLSALSHLDSRLPSLVLLLLLYLVFLSPLIRMLTC